MLHLLKSAWRDIPSAVINALEWTWRGTVGGFGGARTQRYFWLAVSGICVIWALTITYLVFAPRSYVSEFTFVLPGSGAGASVNLEQIGQASSISQSPFSNQRVNPTESYKRLLLSDRIRNAAKDTGDFEWLPRPHVKLLDQTQFIKISIVGSTPDEARDRALAYERAFLSEVDALRAEERHAREAGYKQMIGEFEEGVSRARAALLQHQSTTGLASLAQFDKNVALVDSLSVELNEAHIVEKELARRRHAILRALRLEPENTDEALVLAADPAFIALAAAHAEKETFLSETVYKFGENHPQRIKAVREHRGLTDEIAARAYRHIKIPRGEALRYARLLASAEYSGLLKSAIDQNAAYEAARERREALTISLESERERLKTLSIAAAKLDDLNRAHQVAEAVFRSAMARIDTNKTDLFASYPLVQTVEAPITPDKPASPMVIFAIAGAVAGTIFYLMGLALTCLRLPILTALSKSD